MIYSASFPCFACPVWSASHIHLGLGVTKDSSQATLTDWTCNCPSAPEWFQDDRATVACAQSRSLSLVCSVPSSEEVRSCAAFGCYRQVLSCWVKPLGVHWGILGIRSTIESCPSSLIVRSQAGTLLLGPCPPSFPGRLHIDTDAGIKGDRWFGLQQMQRVAGEKQAWFGMCLSTPLPPPSPLSILSVLHQWDLPTSPVR